MENSVTFDDCPACGYKSLDSNTNDSYIDALCHVCEYREQSHRAIKDGEDIAISAYCLVCDCENCVVNNGYGVRCTECNETFTHMTTCEFCNESFAGAMEEDAGDYQNGCPFCRGKIGYLMDKDD
jgi:hypothetical protein